MYGQAGEGGGRCQGDVYTLSHQRIHCREISAPHHTRGSTARRFMHPIKTEDSLIGDIPFDCLISSRIFCVNTLKIWHSFIKNKKKHPQKLFFLEILKHDARDIPKILDIMFFCPTFLFYWVFLVI